MPSKLSVTSAMRALARSAVSGITPTSTPRETVAEKADDVKGFSKATGMSKNAPFLPLPGCPASSATGKDEPIAKAAQVRLGPCCDVECTAEFGAPGSSRAVVVPSDDVSSVARGKDPGAGPPRVGVFPLALRPGQQPTPAKPRSAPRGLRAPYVVA